MNQSTCFVDGRELPINGERNLLELCRNHGIDIPTFCYHSELSISGACRLCLVDIDGRGIVTSCSTTPEPGMRLRTSTSEIRAMRKMTAELLLADHDMNCPTCPKSAACKLQDLARRLGINDVRFAATRAPQPIDTSSPAIVRNPNRCVLCGDCVRACHEIQEVGAIDFAHRGSDSSVQPAFDKGLDAVSCVHCGNCAAVCPTGALSVAREIEAVWNDLDNPDKTVVVQFAPAVRVAIGEHFGQTAGSIDSGRLVAALRHLGFDQVYDTSFAADLTVLEETHEFLARVETGGPLPLFTSCCPAWVTFAEQFAPDMLPHLSTCKSPQQMFGSVVKASLPERLGIDRSQLVVVSVMPCSAKKAEAKRPEFRAEGQADVDHVITTAELGAMIEERGIDFLSLEPASVDMPFGFKTGAGVIFGASGGVAEAVLRYAAGLLNGAGEDTVFEECRGESGVRDLTVQVGQRSLRLTIVNNLANARRVIEEIRSGQRQTDLVEVMTCTGGCIGGAGQPQCDRPLQRQARAKGLYDADRMLQLHRSQENHMVAQVYTDLLGEPGSATAHRLLHTHYRNRKRIVSEGIACTEAPAAALPVWVCIGTTCHLRGGQHLLSSVIERLRSDGLEEQVQVEATFCLERCGEGPNVMVGDQLLSAATIETVMAAIHAGLAKAQLATH